MVTGSYSTRATFWPRRGDTFLGNAVSSRSIRNGSLPSRCIPLRSQLQMECLSQRILRCPWHMQPYVHPRRPRQCQVQTSNRRDRITAISIPLVWQTPARILHPHRHLYLYLHLHLLHRCLTPTPRVLVNQIGSGPVMLFIGITSRVTGKFQRSVTTRALEPARSAHAQEVVVGLEVGRSGTSRAPVQMEMEMEMGKAAMRVVHLTRVLRSRVAGGRSSLDDDIGFTIFFSSSKWERFAPQTRRNLSLPSLRIGGKRAAGFFFLSPGEEVTLARSLELFLVAIRI